MESRSRLGDLTLLRPFLGLSRRDVLLALTALGISEYFVDPLDQRGLGERAHARNILLPLLGQAMAFPDARLSQISELQQEKNATKRKSFLGKNRRGRLQNASLSCLRPRRRAMCWLN